MTQQLYKRILLLKCVYKVVLRNKNDKYNMCMK